MSRPWAGAAALQLMVVALCTQVPLVAQVGYPFGLVTALLAGPIGLHLALALPRQDARTRQLVAAWRAGVTSLGPGLGLILASGFYAGHCDLHQGLVFWLAMPLGSMVTGATLGWAVGELIVGPWRRHIAGAVALWTCAALALGRLYTQPPITLYDPLWGYISGSLYDEAVSVPWRLGVVRLQTAGLMAACYGAAALMDAGRPRRRAWALALLICSAWGSHGLTRSQGLAITRAEIESVLSVTRERPGLVLHLPHDIDAATADALADDHAYRHGQLCQRMGLDRPRLVHSYVYRDAGQKGALMGGAHTMVAKPWLAQVHVHGLEVPHPLIAHEMAHALAAAWAPGPLHVPARARLWPNMGLIEGLAVALAPEDEGVGLLAMAQALEAMRLSLPWPQLMGGAAQFWAAPPQRAYAQAGVLLRLVEAKVGAKGLARLYATGDFRAATGLALPEWGRRVEAQLAAASHVAAAQAPAQVAMRRRSIFARRCPQQTAVLREQAWATADPQAAAALWQTVAARSGDDADDVLAQALSLLRAREPKQTAARALHARLAARSDLSPSQLRRLALSRARAEVEAGDWPKVAQACTEILAPPKPRGDGDAVDREAWVWRYAAMAQAPLRRAIACALSGHAGPKAVTYALSQQAGDATAAYLLGRALYAEGDLTGAVYALQAAGPHPFAPIDIERLRMLARAALRRSDAATLAQAARQLTELSVLPGDVAWAQDLIARAQAMRSRACGGPDAQPPR